MPGTITFHEPGGDRTVDVDDPKYSNPTASVEYTGPSVLPKPPADWVAPNYQDRDRFEHKVLESIGFDPYDIDPMEEVSRADSRLPELFNHVFRGRATWNDKDRLDRNESQFWDQTVKRYHSDVYQRALSRKNTAIQKHNYMMRKFDNRAKEYNAALERVRKLTATMTKAPTTKNIVNPDGKLTVHQWDPGKLQWVDTGMLAKEQTTGGAKGPKRSDVQAIFNFESKIIGALDEGDRIPPNTLRAMNRMRQAAGLPLLEETAKVGEAKGLLSDLKRWLVGPGDSGMEWKYTEQKSDVSARPQPGVTHMYVPGRGMVAVEEYGEEYGEEED